MRTKRKLILGVLCLSLLLGVSTVFASTDIGGQLLMWYNNRFGEAKVEIKAELDKYGQEIAPGLIEEKNELIDRTKGNIVRAANEQVFDSFKRINATQSMYNRLLIAKKQEIVNGMPKQFADYVAELNEATKDVVDRESDLAWKEIESAIREQGDASTTEVKDKVTESKETAIKKLIENINKTKDELQNLINEKRETAEQDVKNHLDAQIDIKKVEIEEKVAKLEAEIKEIIESEGKRIEQEAAEEMEKIIGEMNP